MTYIAIWIVSFLAIAGVIIRPFKIPEAIWAVCGAVVLVISGLILPSECLTGIAKGTDVYLFLTGMMLLAETAREEKLGQRISKQAFSFNLFGGDCRHHVFIQ
jgi:arsenical pump membrane protein